MDEARVSIVTGGTSGIGWHTARALAKRGDTVILVGRNPDRCNAARDRILAEFPDAMVDTRLADFASLAQVDALASGIITDYNRVDVLVNNAGGFYSTRQLSQDGFELTWATNHLAPFLLTHRLLPLLRASAPSRIVTVSSAAHISTSINFDDLQAERSYSGLRAYAQSKLANILFTYEVAHRLADSDVTANALHPGFVATGFGSNNTGMFMALNGLLAKFFAISPEAGAQTSIALAMDPTLSQSTGLYFSQAKPVASSRASNDVTSRRRLWDLSMRQCEIA
jgi:NAD(P)-dependent dehydrogenase (short-subunit alcohol dehydrogenase family)